MTSTFCYQKFKDPPWRSFYDRAEGSMSHSSIAFTLKMATVLLVLLTDTAGAAGNPERGARDFRACAACHSVNAGEHSTGPSLANLWSRKAGTAEGFSGYSEALKGANLVWDESSLDKWLNAPQQFIPGTSMSFRGIKDAQERADIIAYLKTVSKSMTGTISQQDSMGVTPQRPSR